ncbi:hypothetical protein LTR94_026198, partial [Friedmanniomyces endolithicus]
RAFYRRPTSSASLDLSKHPSVTLLAGPTASGKSALALKLAHQSGAVIINADSQQLYSDLRVLTARPTVADEAAAEHRLYGVADAGEAWSAGRGTGLYFSVLTRGLADIPPVAPAVREEAEALYSKLGEEEFRTRLGRFDPQAAAAIERGDRQRLVRAQSVLSATGRSLSDWKAQTQPLLEPGRWEGRVIEPERARLYANCDLRVEMMLEQGALEEVEALAARRLDPRLPAMKAVGVRELADFIEGRSTREAATEALKQATRNYAKRQLTWFRNQTADWARTAV